MAQGGEVGEVRPQEPTAPVVGLAAVAVPLRNGPLTPAIGAHTAAAGCRRSGQHFLEPVVGVRLVVEGGDLREPGPAVQLDSLPKGVVGLQAQHPHPALAGQRLEALEQAQVCNARRLLCKLMRLACEEGADWLV